MFARMSCFSPSLYQKIEVIVRHALDAFTARESRRSSFKTVCYRSGLHHVDRNVDVAPRGVGICTCLAVRGVDNGLGNFALQARQADVKPCPEEVNVARIAQVYFGIDGYVSLKFDLHLVGNNPHRTNETGRPTSGKQLLRIATSSWNYARRLLNIQAAPIAR